MFADHDEGKPHLVVSYPLQYIIGPILLQTSCMIEIIQSVVPLVKFIDFSLKWSVLLSARSKARETYHRRHC